MTMLQDSEIAGKIFVAIEKLGDSKFGVESGGESRFWFSPHPLYCSSSCSQVYVLCTLAEILPHFAIRNKPFAEHE